jgi:hypothetical protein
LASVRRMVWRAAFFADLVLAIRQVLNYERLRHRWSRHARKNWG